MTSKTGGPIKNPHLPYGFRSDKGNESFSPNLQPLLSGDKHRLTVPIDPNITPASFYNRLRRAAKPYRLRIRNNGNGTVDLWRSKCNYGVQTKKKGL